AVVSAGADTAEAGSEGYAQSGGAGITHSGAQTQWVTGESAMYPSGSWIETEQRDVTPEDYEMMACAVPLLSSSAALPLESMHATAGEPLFIPSAAADGA